MSIAKKILEAVKPVNEAGKSAGAIKALIDAKPSDDNKDQGKFAELIKGLAFSDEPEATAFMKKLMAKVDQSFAAKVSESEKEDDDEEEEEEDEDEKELDAGKKKKKK